MSEQQPTDTSEGARVLERPETAETAPTPAAAVTNAPAEGLTEPAAQGVTFQSMADRLTPGLLASVIGAVLVFISAFLTWSTVDARSQAGSTISGAVTDSIGISGGRLGTATLVLSLAALAVVGVMLLPATKAWAWQVLLGAGLLSVFFTLVDAISIPKTLRPNNFTCPSQLTCTFHRTIGPGVWFTLVASVLIVAGAYVHHLRPVPFRSPSAPIRRRKTTVDLTKS